MQVQLCQQHDVYIVIHVQRIFYFNVLADKDGSFAAFGDNKPAHDNAALFDAFGSGDTASSGDGSGFGETGW